MKLRFLAAAAALAICGCASTSAPVVNGPGMVRVEATGDYTHAASGHVFPAQIEQFTRVSVFRGRDDAQRLTVGYSGGSPQCLTAITMFVIPFSGNIEDAFAQAKGEVVEAFPDASLEREAAHPKLVSRFADYNVGDRRLQVVVEQTQPGWAIKYRVMFPATCVDSPLFVGGFFNAWGARQPGGMNR